MSDIPSNGARGAADPSGGDRPSFERARLLLGAATALLAVSWLPLHRLLDPERTGLAGRATRVAAEAAWEQALVGSILLLLAATALGRFVVPAGAREMVARVTATLNRTPLVAVALGAGVAAALASGVVASVHFGRAPTSVDEMVQLLHARILVTGQAALSLPPGSEAHWSIQNSLFTPYGWASVYPPFHTLLLSVGMALGAPWLIGPIAVGVAVTATVHAVEAAVPDDPALARWSGLAMAGSPFLLVLGATHLSHSTAAALTALALWASLRARNGSTWAAGSAGMASGLLLATRPWTGVVLGAAAAVTCVWPLRRTNGSRPWKRAMAFGAGGSAPVLALLAWNQNLFGHPFRLGYSAAFGPSHGLGFHRDPWGNEYGWVEAVAYTASDLSQLGVHLFETAPPALVLIGLGLAAGAVLPSGLEILAGWLLLGVLSVIPYWHHGSHFGPRLLFEVGPLAAVLTVAAARGLFDLRATPRWGRDGATWLVLLSVLSALVTVPLTLRGPLAAPGPAGRVLREVDDSTVVFAHGSWGSRTAARLVSSGMRRDSVETALRRNDACSVHEYATWRRIRVGPAPPLDLTPRSGMPAHLRSVELAEGIVMSVDPSRTVTAACAREAGSDAAGGSAELEPLLWLAPPLPGARVIVARDLGPEANHRLMEGFPGYTPRVMIGGTRSVPGGILDYEAGMELLWGRPAASDDG